MTANEKEIVLMQKSIDLLNVFKASANCFCLAQISECYVDDVWRYATNYMPSDIYKEIVPNNTQSNILFYTK
jgi:hypothetical protein